MASYSTGPLVSVVIPTYERPQFLSGAIQTALKQTYEDIEVIVVDDGSSEQYADDIVSDFPDNVSWVQHKENKGLSAGRNTGVQESSGEYIAFLDDDDRWHRTKLSRQIEALETDDQAGLATCLVAAVTPDDEVIHCERSAPSGDCSDEILIGNQIGTPSRVVVRRECFSDIGMFDESLQTKQDWDFYLRFCQEWDVVAIEDHLCFRTVHESMSSSTTALRRDKNQILQKHKKLIRQRGMWEQAQLTLSTEIARSYLSTGNLKEARKYSREACSEINFRRILIHLLTFTHPLVVQTVISTKRAFSRYFYSCSSFTNDPKSN